MTTVLACLLVAVLIPYVLVRHRRLPQGPPARKDRQQQPARPGGTAHRRGRTRRGRAAERLGGARGLHGFARRGVLRGRRAGSLALPALIFVSARIAHAACYLNDLASARSSTFLVATLACLWIFGMAFAA